MAFRGQHRFSVAEYYRMAETGILRPGARVELLEGTIMDMSRTRPFHNTLVSRLSRLYNLLANGRWMVVTNNPVSLSDHSELQPDLMLLQPVEDDYASRHPRADDVLLLVEVSGPTLDYDRGEKLAAYGRAGVTEVWIVDLQAAAIEVHREPQANGYAFKTVLNSGLVSPLVFPEAGADVADLFSR